MPPPLSELPSETSSVVHPKEQPATHNQGASHPTHPSLVTAKVIQKHNSKPLEKLHLTVSPAIACIMPSSLTLPKDSCISFPWGQKGRKVPPPFWNIPPKPSPPGPECSRGGQVTALFPVTLLILETYTEPRVFLPRCRYARRPRVNVISWAPGSGVPAVGMFSVPKALGDSSFV